MKTKIAVLFMTILTLVSCGENTSTTQPTTPPEWSYNAVMYEMNVRQLTPEGTFAAAEEYLPQLQKLGVDIIWLMPLQPIGIEGRKGTLGSYYAISDYCDVNPEFGTLENFDSFIAKAQSLGMKVIIDWVANHTSRDSKWLLNEPKDWFIRDENGEAVYQYDWTDIAKLNYESDGMRAAMIDAMKFWVERGVDGFRCDMAELVPLDFWQKTIPELKKVNSDIFLLAEAENPNQHEDAFDATYGWSLHHLMNAIAKQEKGVSELVEYVTKDTLNYPKNAFRLMFTSNHDENSWAGTEFERMGDGAQTFAALTYILPQGMPLIYTGQEVGFNRRLEFFEKDMVDSLEPNEFTDFYTTLNDLRHTNSALRSGELGGVVTILPTNGQVFAIVRQNDKNSVIGIFNLSPNETTFQLDLSKFKGKYTNIFDNQSVEISSQFDFGCLNGWEFLILTK